MKYLLDTCVVSELSKKRPSESVLRWFESVEEDDLLVSSVTIGELRKGIEMLADDDARRLVLEAWYISVVVDDRAEPDRRCGTSWRSCPASCAASALRGLRGDARAGLTVRLLVAVTPLAFVALDLFRDWAILLSQCNEGPDARPLTSMDWAHIVAPVFALTIMTLWGVLGVSGRDQFNYMGPPRWVANPGLK